jgi:hypothetical protein
MKKNVSQYTFHNLIDIRFADPVSAMGMNERYVVIGTMMGRSAFLSIPDKKTTLLSELQSENITGISFETNDSFSVAIGDDEVLKYQFDSSNNTGQNLPSCSRLKNYENEIDHKNRCESCFTLLSKDCLLLIYLNQPSEGCLDIQKSSTNFIIKNLRHYSIEEGTIEMTNYSVPFDFDGERFAWVEFLSEESRNICVYYMSTRKKYEYFTLKNYGHISHMKLLPNNKLFLVRNLNICEIRELNANFTKIREFKHIGDEVIACDVYVNQSKVFGGNEIELDNIQVNNKNNDQYIKIPGEKSAPREKELVQINENEQFQEENLSIVLLDIDGNVNVWENLSISKKFNMYDLKDINNDYKEKQFFSMGYPYFIKMNMNYYAISTDHGVFVIKKI